MPLLDHFRPPLSERRPWQSFYATFCDVLADRLNRIALPSAYVAINTVRDWPSPVEIDVSGPWPALPSQEQARASWLPAAAPVILPTEPQPSYTVELGAVDGSRTLVAVIELVSPGNKDSTLGRRQFAAKCATYLSRGVGLIVLDLVTTRHANLHNELIDLLGLDGEFRMPDTQALYCVAYRPLTEGGRIDTWPAPLEVGRPLPTMPLSLAADHCLPVDLEVAYVEACRRRRLDEVTG